MQKMRQQLQAPPWQPGRSVLLIVGLIAAIGLLAAVGAFPRALRAANVHAPAATTITVTRSDDPESSSIVRTCDYDSGVYKAAEDGCSLRRAIVEAGARPAADRPIAIEFALAAEDSGYDANDDIWMLTVDDMLNLKPFSITDKNGQVTIDGDTQPGGRSEGPKVYIDTNDNSLEIRLTNNTVRNLGFVGGGAIFLYEGENVVEFISMGLSPDGNEIVLRDPSDPKRMAGGGIQALSDGNTLENNVISGTFARAIELQGDNNIVDSNYIGTRADGSVPVVPENIQCIPSFAYDPGNWYGGWGIQLSGSNNQITNNLIAGLHNLRSTNDTPPRAIEIFGANHLIQNNVIGLDTNEYAAGVCGQGIKVSGSGTQIVENRIVASRVDSEDAEETAIFASDTSPLFGQISVRKNLVEDGPGKVYSFGAGIPDALRFFKPAKVTGISSIAISGSSGDDSACPGCLVDIYLDDGDDVEDALDYLGSAEADSNGDWSYPLAAPLSSQAFVRTNSTTQSSGVIGSFGAGTSTKLSSLYTDARSVTISGPTSGDVDTEYKFSITTSPITTEKIYAYTVTVTDRTDPLTGQFSSLVNANLVWSSAGEKTIEVRAETPLGFAVATHTIMIGDDATPEPTPTSTPKPTSTPGPTSTPAPTTTPSSSGDQRVYLPVVTR